MTVPRRAPLAAALLLLAAAAAALLLRADQSGAQRSLPSVIPLPNGWQPEGIASGPGNALYVGSIPTGRVVRVDARTGRRRVVVPRRSGRRAIGLKASRGLLYVAGGPTGRGFVYRASNGASLANVRLTAAPTFINDVTVTRSAAWFTDSQRQQLYRLPLRANGRPSGAAQTVPITGDLQYDDDAETFEANGIAATAQGSLLVVQSRTGGLFLVSPQGASTQVQITGGDGRGLVNGDGLLLAGRTLYAVQNQLNRIAVVDLEDDFSRGEIRRYLRDSDLDVPTTVARKGSSLYAVNARFGTDATPSTEYDVVRVRPGG
jgi:sugar lactone lactonase YvrE